MIIDKVQELKARIKRDKGDNISTSAVLTKIKMNEEALFKLENSREYELALAQKAEKSKKIRYCPSGEHGKNPIANTNRDYLQKNSIPTAINHNKPWMDNDLATVYLSGIIMEISSSNDSFFTPVSENAKIKELYRKVGRTFLATEAQIRVKEIYLIKKDIRDFYKVNGILNKSGKQMKRVLDKMIKEGKLKFKDNVTTLK